MDALHYTYTTMLKNPAHSRDVRAVLNQFASDVVDAEELKVRRHSIARLQQLGETEIANELAARLRSLERAMRPKR